MTFIEKQGKVTLYVFLFCLLSGIVYFSIRMIYFKSFTDVDPVSFRELAFYPEQLFEPF